MEKSSDRDDTFPQFLKKENGQIWDDTFGCNT